MTRCIVWLFDVYGQAYSVVFDVNLMCICVWQGLQCGILCEFVYGRAYTFSVVFDAYLTVAHTVHYMMYIFMAGLAVLLHDVYFHGRAYSAVT